MRPMPRKKTKPFLKETLQMLLSLEPTSAHEKENISSDETKIFTDEE